MRKLLQAFKNLKFRYKLTLLVLTAGLIPVAIIVVYMQSGMMELLHENEVDNLEKSLQQAVETIENQEQIYENLVDYLSYSQDLRDILIMEPQSDYDTYEEYVDVADPLLQMPQLYHREIREITLYAETIEVPHGNTLMPLERAKEQGWYAQLDGGSLMQWTVTRGASQEITASRKFYEGNDITAVLSMSLDYKTVLEPFTNILRDNMGGIVLDADGTVVYAGYSMDEEYRPSRAESLEYIQDNYTCSVQEMEGTGWVFCMYRPTEVITRSATELLVGNIPLVGICLVLLVLLGYVFSRRTVSCLERLTANMNQIHLGFRKVTVSSNSNDEVGVLIRSFRRMMEQMNHLISEVYEAKIQLQNSEMKALQAQINPHFLYNSLSIINWKALEAGEDEISKVTLALSTYYRTSLNRGETMTTVENELNNIRAYLKIQLIMHDNSFHVIEKVVLDNDMMQLRIPKLILQPFVENAINHGLDLSEKEEKRLTVAIGEEADTLLFEISDNGAGMEREKAQEILSYQSPGYGVRNVCERIRVLYGEEGNVTVESREGEGTKVTVRIPKKAEKRLE